MGRDNQQRRAAKKRRRQRAANRAGQPPPGAGGTRDHVQPPPRRPRPEDPARPEELLRAAVIAWGDDPELVDRALRRLARQPAPALTAAGELLTAAIDGCAARGWAARTLLHVVGRRLHAAHRWLVAAHLDGEEPPWPPDPATAVLLAVELLSLLERLPALPGRAPPAGGSRDRSSPGRPRDERMLDRVRALLAKAESTEFEEEAEALVAKAQELITRHAIDEALLDGGDPSADPSVRHLPVDDPYADAKAWLVAQVAATNRCRTVFLADLGLVTTFGYPGDLDAVELLTTSLLAQATGAMLRHGSRRDAAGRSRTRSFRRAFLLGFAQRIGERLREVTDEEVAAHTGDGRLVPVLAARDDRLREVVREAFPETTEQSASVGNADGWYSGRLAGDQADLSVSPHRLPDG
jgi:hypothetical protein